MLTKSQAKAFFVVGTATLSLVFIGLTIDTFRKVPTQTNAAALTPAAIRGKHLFDHKNCMGCHTILGEGAYYAPELTKVYERRGEGFIKAMLKNPEAMYPGQRKMTNYHFSDQEIDDLTEFLKWVGQMDLNGFPPKPDLGVAAAAPSIAPSNSGANANAQNTSKVVHPPNIYNQVCIACHALGGKGGNVGPALDGVGSRRDAEYLKKWLQDPLAVKADSKMPKLPLTESEITELTAFLTSLKSENIQ